MESVAIQPGTDSLNSFTIVVNWYLKGALDGCTSALGVGAKLNPQYTMFLGPNVDFLALGPGPKYTTPWTDKK